MARLVSSSDILDARILVVDDQEANVLLLELILLDLQMPGMDGFQVMEGLKAIETDGYLPVLVITAQPGHKLRALQAGAKDFVSKPFEMAELRARVHNSLEVRLLYVKLTNCVSELEASREVIRLKTL